MTNNIHRKLQIIQSQIGQLAKTEENKFQKYKYVAEYEILKALKPLLNETKLTLTFSDKDYVDTISTFKAEKVEKEWIVQYLKKATITNSEKPEEKLTYHFWATGQNTDIAKAKGSAETYAIKYFLMKFFLIPTSDNLDPDIMDNKLPTPEEKKQADEFLNNHGFSEIPAKNYPKCIICKGGLTYKADTRRYWCSVCKKETAFGKN